MAEKLTPMMQQYLEIKEQYKDSILFFRLGDFYEMFFDDAITVSKELQLTLTGKSCGLKERAPMCGVPFHAAENYIGRLIEKGYKVVICEQVEDPALAKGLVKREVTSIITPGTRFETSMLDNKANNYLAALYQDEDTAGLAYCDISTGELFVLDILEKDNLDEIINELIKIDVREVIIAASLKESELLKNIKELTDAYITYLNDSYFEINNANAAICRQFSVTATDGLGVTSDNPSFRALGTIFAYLFETQKQNMSQITHITIVERGSNMTLDKSAVRNLELMETLFEKKINGSLLGILDCTETAMGSRMLKKWIREPLNKSKIINARLSAVEVLIDDLLLHNNIRNSLKLVYDLERLTGKVAFDRANASDLLALRNSIKILPDLKGYLESTNDPLLNDLGKQIKPLIEVFEMIDTAICEDPPNTIREGGIIKAGYSNELDNIKESSGGSLNWIMNLEVQERAKTGIKKLKVGFNKVFGYYIEVSNSNLELVPEHYIRKQTLVNCERYITPELKEMEALVLNAEARINSLEYELFTQLRNNLKKFIVPLQETAISVAQLDVLASYAEISNVNGYVKPDVNDGDIINIIDGRHPVIEQSVNKGVFVANDIYMDRSEESLLLITGPNMAGKSTYMRQTALIVLMAQIGCFVPAKSAVIGTVDRIYTRIGASDNLSQGQSTFFVEMKELAYILNTATERSLVILDEIGRGTSTYDGLSIAWAAVNYLCNKNRHIRTMFASHYHELTNLEKNIKGIKNLNVAVSESSGQIVFLHKITYGSASKSYGIHVAHIAGVPEIVLQDAEDILNELEKKSSHNEMIDISSVTEKKNLQKLSKDEMAFLALKNHPVIEQLKSLNIMDVTPGKAILILEELISTLKNQ